MGHSATSLPRCLPARSDRLRGVCNCRLPRLCRLHFFGLMGSQCKPVGDRVLQAVASALHSATVSGNVLGRLGGDEFAVAISHIDGTALVAVANQIRSSFNQVVGQLGVQATLSIGVVSSEDCPRGEMLSCADIALYLAKSSGRDRAWLYDPDTDHAGGVFTECEI